MGQEKILVATLIQAKESYYAGHPMMSDEKFDKLEDELRKIDPKNEYFEIVGAGIKGKKITHEVPMLSCGKANYIPEVAKWMDKICYKGSYIIEPKIDGMSADLKFVDGKFMYMATRGDGLVGEDISYAAKYLNVPKTIPIKGTVEIRGELYLPKDTKFPNQENKPLRNIAVGLVKRKTGREDIKHVKFIAYQLLCEKPHKTEYDKVAELKELKFDTIEIQRVKTINEIETYYNKYQSTLRSDWGYETDGLVIVVDDISMHKVIDGKYEVSHHHHYNIALKPPAEFKETEVIDVEWNISRHGNLIPVVILKPVIIGGAKIQRVTANNYQNIENLDLCYGATVLITRANDVIPYLKEVVKNGTSSITIDKCPSCGSKLVRNGVHISCKNANCKEVNFQKIMYWVYQCKMDGVSDATIRMLFDENVIKDIKSLYNIKYSSLNCLNGLGDKKIDNLKAQIDQSREMTSTQFIARLGIPLVGEKAVKKLELKSMNDFWNFDDDTYAIGKNLIDFKNENEDFIRELEKVITIKNKADKKSGGLKVCMTGTGPKGRKELKTELEKMGYEVVDSVDKETNILICEDVNASSGKLAKARKLGIELKSYNEVF